jgi:hypothetical protein
MKDFMERFAAPFQRLQKMWWSDNMTMEVARIVGRYPFDENGDFSKVRKPDEHPENLGLTWVAIIFRYNENHRKDERSLLSPFCQQCGAIILGLGINPILGQCEDLPDRFTIRTTEDEAIYRQLPPLRGEW